MNKIDLTSKEWCDLVFEGKNKAFGAYEMRMDSPRRHNRALLIVVLGTVAAIAVPALLRFVAPAPVKETMTEVTTLSQLPPPEIKNNNEIKRIDAPPPPPLKSSIKFTAPVIKRDEEVAEAEEIKSQDELASTKVAISIADVKGNDELTGSDIADIKEVAPTPDEAADFTYDVVEQMPQFPGGEQKLMEYLQKHLSYPAVASENGIQGRVLVRFVVTKAGKIEKVEVMRGLDPSCDREAVRVVQSMPNWIPGKQNGEAVSVYFALPVVFRLR